ncbi:MAG: protein kinase [Xanthomonadales bacterium]|nr:protein kinase [Xanthomonadales bacterium]
MAEQDWQAMARWFDTLVELSPAQREQRLKSLHDADPALAGQVRRLLAADQGDDGPLDRAVVEAVPEVASGDTRPALMPGDTVGPWRLVAAIGEGGMGEVWRARRDDGAFQREVAVKLLKRGLDTEALLRRFRQERDILARLDHPGIVRLLDAGTTADGRPWYAMEQVDGLPLREHAAHQGLDVRERVALVARIADAVAYAHAHLVVHRDLKPSNVLVDATGQPRLLDFGIAKLLEPTAGQTLTGTGMHVLSPAYAAPEQVLGQPVGTAADVYGLAVLLFELLTGQLPHRRQSRDLAALAAEVGSDVPTAPASEVLRRASGESLTTVYGPQADTVRLSREVRGDLDLILAMALRPEPARRHATAAAFAEDLRAWLAGRPVRAKADSAGYRARRFLRRNAVAVAAAGAVLAALLVGLGGALWQAGIARAEAARAEAQAEQARNQARRAQATRDFVVTAFEELIPTESAGGVQLSLADFIRAALARLDPALADAPESRLELREVLATALQELGHLDEAREALLQLERELDAHPQVGDAAMRGSVLHMIGVNLLRTGQLDQALGYSRRALDLLDAVEAPTPEIARVRQNARTGLASEALTRGRYHEVVAHYEAMIEDEARISGGLGADAAVLFVNLCTTRANLGQHAQAIADCERADALLATRPEAAAARQVWVDNALGHALVAAGRHDEAVDRLTATLAEATARLGESHTMTGTVMGNLATAHSGRGDRAQALALIERYGTLVEAGAVDPRRRAPAAALRGRVLLENGRVDQAEPLLRQALADAGSIGIGDSATILRSRRLLAGIEQARGNPAAAAELLDQAIAGFARVGLDRHEELARSLRARAALLREAGDEDGARHLEARAVAAGHLAQDTSDARP